MRLLVRGSSIAAGYGVQKGYVEVLSECLVRDGIEVLGFPNLGGDGLSLLRPEG